MRSSSTFTGANISLRTAVECLAIQFGVGIIMVEERQLVVGISARIFEAVALVDPFAKRGQQNGEACNS